MARHADEPDGGGPPTADGSVARARASVYGTLAATFDGEVETLAAALESGAFARLGAALPTEMPSDALARTDLDAETLRIGYDNLFAVPGPHYVPPFASAHADEPSESVDSDSPYHEGGQAGELLGAPAAAAARAYAVADFEPQRGDGLPDHVAASFEFMRALCEREAALLQSEGPAEEIVAVRGLQRETVGRLAWLDAFHEAVAQEDAAEGVFAPLALFARVFVAWDADEGIPSPPGPADDR